MRVSVVVATRNAGRTLERCLRSVRDQNFDDVEIVVVDNGSTDTTLEVADRLADIVVTAGPERSAQRNSGAAAASGDVLMFVDADMVLEPGVVRDAAGRISASDVAAVVIPERSFGDGFWARCKALEKLIALNDPAVEAARVFRRGDFDAVAGYDEGLTACEDWDLADRISEAAPEAATERTSSVIWHDEGRLRLRTTFDKKRYYGRWVAEWLRTAPDHRRHRDLRSKLGRLARQPVTATGLIVMKLVEVLGFLAGMVDNRRAQTVQWTMPPDPTERAERRRVTAAIGGAAVVGAAVVQSWFEPGKFVASGDNGPWMRGLGTMTRSWSDTLIGTGSTAYPSASLLEGVSHDALVALGLSEPTAQRIFYSLVLAATAAATAYLAAALTRRPLAILAAGVVVALAPFHITTLPNILPIVAIGALSFILGIVARSAAPTIGDGTARHVLRPMPAASGALAALWISPLAKNPPLLALVVVCVGVAVVIAAIADRHAPRRLLATAMWFIAGSLFWIVPLALHFALGTPGLTIVAETDVDAWSWTQRHSGVPNVVTLVASWVWGDPHILPATATLSRAPWSVLRWGLPVLGLMGVVLARYRRTALALAATAGVFVVLSVGLNAPFAGVNHWLLDHVPGFWLYRQPMSKFGVVLVVVYGLLTALAVDGVSNRAALRGAMAHDGVRRGATVVLAVAMAAAVAFAFPLYTGSVIPGQRTGEDVLPPARVEVPASWYAAGRWLDQAPLQGSVVVLPLSDYYQRGTTWGYYGVDDLMWRITDRRALYVLPGGYYAAAGSSPALMEALQIAVATGDGAATARLMDALGAAYVAVRTDYASTPGRSFADGRRLVADADANEGLRPEHAFEHVHLYSARAAVDGPSTSATVDVRSGLSPRRVADVVAASPPGVTVVEDDGLPGAADAWQPTDGDTVHTFANADGEHLITARPNGPLVWQARRVNDGNPGVAIDLASTLGVDGDPVTDVPTRRLATDGDAAALVVDGDVVELGDEPAFFEADGGTRVDVLQRGATATLGSTETTLGNCNNTDDVDLDTAGITAGAVPGGVVLRAAAGSACLSFPVPTAPTPIGRPVWRVRAKFERSSGETTRICLWLPASRRCAQGTPAPTPESSGSIDVVVRTAVRDDPSGAQLVMYADHADGAPAPAEVRFTDVSVEALTASPSSGPLAEVGTTTVVRDLVAGETAVTANDALTGDFVQYVATDVADCHDYDDAPDAENRIGGRALGAPTAHSIELRARRHSACVGSPVAVPTGLRHLTVSFEHRTRSGAGSRWCLMGAGPACVASGRLSDPAEWRRFSTDIVLGADVSDAPTSSGLYRLYLYADGAGADIAPRATTSVQYRAVSVRATYPLVAVIQPARRSTPATSARTGDTRFLSGRGPVLVTLRESFADDWELTGLPAGSTARHTQVDGWANGWIVDRLPDGWAAVGFRYGPDRWAGLAVWSLVVVLAAATLTLVRHRRASTAFHPRSGRSS